MLRAPSRFPWWTIWWGIVLWLLGTLSPAALQRIAAVVALKQQQSPGSPSGVGGSGSGGRLTLPELRSWAADQLPAYQLPAELVVLPAIPRNVMGKANKKELREQLFPAASAAAA